MSEDSSATYYQNNKERLQKSNNRVVNDAKIYQKMKSKSLLSIEKNIKWEKAPYYNYKRRDIKNNVLKNNDLESSFDEE